MNRHRVSRDPSTINYQLIRFRKLPRDHSETPFLETRNANAVAAAEPAMSLSAVSAADRVIV
jgi:hypothetical protein